MHPGVHRLSKQFRRCVTQHPGSRGIDEGGIAISIQPPHPAAHGFKQKAGTSFCLLACGQQGNNHQSDQHQRGHKRPEQQQPRCSNCENGPCPSEVAHAAKKESSNTASEAAVTPKRNAAQTTRGASRKASGKVLSPTVEKKTAQHNAAVTTPQSNNSLRCCKNSSALARENVRRNGAAHHPPEADVG